MKRILILSICLFANFGFTAQAEDCDSDNNYVTDNCGYDLGTAPNPNCVCDADGLFDDYGYGVCMSAGIYSPSQCRADACVPVNNQVRDHCSEY